MRRLFWCVLLGGLIFASPLYAKERKLNPFQDYIFIIFHGINDSRFSFNGESPEFTEEDKRARDVFRYLTKDLKIPEPYVKLYSYTQNRGSNIQNAKELGMPGYMAWHDGFQLGGAGLDAVVGLSSMLNLLNMRDLQFIATVTHIASGLHNTAPQIDYNAKALRDEFFSYHPSMLQHYATGVQPGHSFLEQAVIDFKNDYLISDLNFNTITQKRFYQTIEDIPDTIVPKKFIFLGHSMSNMSMRLYVYSNELAEKGKFFDKGFYKDDVEKIVFMAPPMEGTEMAIGSLGLPFIKKSQLESIEKDLNGAAISDAYTYITGLWDRLKDPWLPIKDPMWPYTIGGPPMANMLRLYRYPKAKQYVAGYLGLTDPPSALFYPGTWEMIPDEVRLELLRTGADVGIDVAMGLAAGLGANGLVQIYPQIAKWFTDPKGVGNPMPNIDWNGGLAALQNGLNVLFAPANIFNRVPSLAKMVAKDNVFPGQSYIKGVVYVADQLSTVINPTAIGPFLDVAVVSAFAPSVGDEYHVGSGGTEHLLENLVLDDEIQKVSGNYAENQRKWQPKYRMVNSNGSIAPNGAMTRAALV